MTERKTNRKNKTKQVINWPSTNVYFTIDSLIGLNQHMLTDGKKSDITIRVRLKKTEEQKLVAEIGTKNTGKGRPIKIYSMTPVSQSSIDCAFADNILLHTQYVPTMTVVDVNNNQSDMTTSHVVNPSKALQPVK